MFETVETQCLKCKGTGRVHADACVVCGGRGVVRIRSINGNESLDACNRQLHDIDGILTAMSVEPEAAAAEKEAVADPHCRWCNGTATEPGVASDPEPPSEGKLYIGVEATLNQYKRDMPLAAIRAFCRLLEEADQA